MAIWICEKSFWWTTILITASNNENWIWNKAFKIFFKKFHIKDYKGAWEGKYHQGPNRWSQHFLDYCKKVNLFFDKFQNLWQIEAFYYKLLIKGLLQKFLEMFKFVKKILLYIWHSSEKRGFHSTFWPRKMLQNLISCTKDKVQIWLLFLSC